MKTYFGSLAVKNGGEIKWPTIRFLPMRWSHSVYVGQAIHENILAKIEELKDAEPISPSASKIITDAPFGVYIDNCFRWEQAIRKRQSLLLPRRTVARRRVSRWRS